MKPSSRKKRTKKAKSVRKPRTPPPAPFLQKWKRNDVVEAMQAARLNPTDFNLKDSDSELQIEHKRSQSYFTVRMESGLYVGQSLVGDGPVWPSVPSGSWQALMPRISTWLSAVKRDLDTPDLWAELQREAEFLAVGTNELTANTPFTFEEQKQIAERLAELARNIEQMRLLSQEQMQFLQGQFKYLTDATNRMGRKDWLMLSIGVILNFFFFGLGVALPSETARTIFRTFFTAIRVLSPDVPLLE
jgi:hypothetical protein